MIYRLTNLALPPDATDRVVRAEAARRLGVTEAEILSLRIRRRSLDARHKPDVRLVFILDAEVELPPDRVPGAKPAPPDLPDPFEAPLGGLEPLRGPPVVVGAGPAGLGAAIGLARLGFRPRVLERGRPVARREADVARFWSDRALDPESNVLFGEGGAGAFSDGKLATRIHDPLLEVFLRALVRAEAPESVLWEAKPHLGTEGVRRAAAGLRGLAEGLGAVFEFERKFEGLEVRGGKVAGVRAGAQVLETGAVVLAPGGWARDTFAALHEQGVALDRKPFQLGLRLEHSQGFIDRMQYGEAIRVWPLPPAEYRFSAPGEGEFGSVFSFCMCPGGVVVPAVSEAGRLSTNGMSLEGRPGKKGNAAFVVTIPRAGPGEGPLSGIEFQRAIEKAGFEAGGGEWRAPAQRLVDFLAGRSSIAVPGTSYPLGVKATDLAAVLPAGAASALRAALRRLARRIPGFAGPEAVLIGPETRTTSAVRILRDSRTMESVSHPGLFPAGEGAGYAGGISSAAVDGLRAALAVARRFRPG